MRGLQKDITFQQIPYYCGVADYIAKKGTKII
jgi:hypothetical protein